MKKAKAVLLRKMANQIWTQEFTQEQRVKWSTTLEVFEIRKRKDQNQQIIRERVKTKEIAKDGFNRFYRALKKQYLSGKFKIK